MDELLYSKLEELSKSLKTLNKPENSLVPALKAPTLKPISANASAAPTKIPGVAPPSGKDPKKVAIQLKNPRPQKPKLTLMKNGQWQLDET